MICGFILISKRICGRWGDDWVSGKSTTFVTLSEVEVRQML